MSRGGTKKAAETSKRSRAKGILRGDCHCKLIPGEPEGVYPSATCPEHGFEPEKTRAFNVAKEQLEKDDEGV